MLRLAMKMLRYRLGSAVATLVALAVGVMILLAMGVLVESGLRYVPAPQRYAAADLVVAHQDLTVTGKDPVGETVTSTARLPEGGTVPATLVEQVGRVPGVAAAVGDTSVVVVPLTAPTAEDRPHDAVRTVGHGWSSAALTPYRIVSGRAPGTDSEIAVDARMVSAAGGRLDVIAAGGRLDVIVAGSVHQYTISGIVERAAGGDQPAAVFFTDAHAATFARQPGRVDAVGVILAPGADRAVVSAAVRRLADGAGAKVYAGADRGLLEQSDALAARDLLVQAGAAFGGYVALLVMFVVAGTIGLAVRHRRRDIALLRAIAATPGQVRRLILAEVGLISLVAVALGVPAGLLAARWVYGELVDRGFVPDAVALRGGALSAVAVTATTVLVAVLAALISARRTAKIRPTEALGETAVEPGRNGKVRLVFGLLSLTGGLSLTVLTAATNGQTALTAAIGMLYVLVLAVGLLAPWINRTAARLLAPVLRTVWGSSGYLAAANLRANAQGMVTVLTALVLSVGFGGSVWFLQDNLQRQALTQSRDGLLAERALVCAVGLPPTAATDAAKIPGVLAATGVLRTSVVVPVLGEAQVVQAQAFDPDGAATTMDLRVTAGSLADLRGASVAVSSLQASSQGWTVGSAARLWLGDGTPVTLRVVAIYERGFGFGDVTLPRETVAGHTATGLDYRVLIRTAPGANVDAALAELAARYPGSVLVDTDDLTGQLARELALSAWLNKLLIGVMVGYAALAAANTMVMAALARGRELALLRLVGVTRRQVKRMVHAEQVGLLGVALLIGGAIAAVTLSAVVNTLTGQPVPYVPALGGVAIVGGTTLLALLTTVLPIGRLLRVAPVESIGIKE